MRGRRPRLLWSARRWPRNQAIRPPQPLPGPSAPVEPTTARRPARNNREAEPAARIRVLSQPGPGDRTSALLAPRGAWSTQTPSATFTNIVLLSPGQDATFTTKQTGEWGLRGRGHAGGGMGVPRAPEPGATVLLGRTDRQRQAGKEVARLPTTHCSWSLEAGPRPWGMGAGLHRCPILHCSPQQPDGLLSSGGILIASAA